MYLFRYSPEVRAQIAKYACVNGSRRASSTFSRKLGKKVSISTVDSIKKSYQAKRKADPDDDISTLPTKKRGRPYLLGDSLDQQVQAYLRKIRDQGGLVTASVAVAAARGIILATDSTKLVEFGGHIELNCHWAYHLFSRMKFSRRKATTSKSKISPREFAKIKATFLNEIVTIVTMEDIPPELVLNWDQTGIHLVHGRWTKLVLNE